MRPPATRGSTGASRSTWPSWSPRCTGASTDLGPHHLAARQQVGAPRAGVMVDDEQPAVLFLLDPRDAEPGQLAGPIVHSDPHAGRAAQQPDLERRPRVPYGVGDQLGHDR